VNRDPELRDALLQGDSSMDSAVRQSAYARALRLISERAYALPLYSTVNYSY
jgi:peptide/nickel transport system substrate-binding protein